MNWSPYETLTWLAPHLPASLVTPEALINIQRLARRLPDTFCSYYLECRLDAAPQVDFLASAVQAEPKRLRMAATAPDSTVDRREDGRWQRIDHVLRQWADPTTQLAQHACMIWLEFDAAQTASNSFALPGICFCLDPTYVTQPPQRGQPTWGPSPLSCGQVQALIEETLPLLWNQPLSPAAYHNLLTCFERLPAEGRLIHISVMLARQPAVLKLYVSLPGAQLGGYLREIGWPGVDAELAAIIAKLCPQLSPLFIDLTIPLTGEEPLAPRLGLACSQVHLWNQTQLDPTWDRLLDQGMAQGWCTPEKRAGLRAWPGSTRVTFSHHAWPTRIRRWLDLKFVYQPGQPLALKGYLGFMPTFSLF